MTIGAGGRDLELFQAMAFCTRHIPMFIQQGIFCQVMIKNDLLPLFRDPMAPVAVLARGAFVFVILFMAFVTDFRSLLKLRRFMAFLAFRFLMRSSKFKLGLVMVKPDFLPRRRRMTGLALFSL